MSALGSHAEGLDRYAHWLGFLSEKDREYVRTQYAEVVEIRAADPDRPVWYEWYLGWTAAAIDAEDPAATLRAAVEGEDGSAVEVCRALDAMNRTSNEWEQWWPAWHPCSN